MSAVSMAPQVFFQPLLAHSLSTLGSANTVDRPMADNGVKNRIKQHSGLPFFFFLIPGSSPPRINSCLLYLLHCHVLGRALSACAFLTRLQATDLYTTS